MKQFVITEQLANTILQYLGKQPYVEVVSLIGGLMQLQELQPKIAITPPVTLVPKGE